MAARSAGDGVRTPQIGASAVKVALGQSQLSEKTGLHELDRATVLVAWFFLRWQAVLGGPATYAVVRGPSVESTLSAGDPAGMGKQDSFAKARTSGETTSRTVLGGSR